MTLAPEVEFKLDKHVPAALVAAFLLQLAGALFWAGTESQRVSVLETTDAAEESAIRKVAVLEEQVSEMKATLERIDQKLDRDKPRESEQ